ncbi:MAG: hypothetical protein H0U26_07555 [Acidimicrobiia bacterium]|nr:hypothetical protein [Acidimicrobiia bacterium]
MTTVVSAPRAPLIRAEAWLFAPERPDRMRFVAAGLAVLVGVRVALSPYRALAGQPDALFDPPWVLRWVPAMPSLSVIIALQVLGTAAAVVAVIGPERRRRLAFAAGWGCLLVLAGLRASRGKILHNDLLLIFACVPFLAAPRPSSRAGWPLRTATAVIALVYFKAGLGKLAAAGLGWVFSDNMRWIMFGAANAEPQRAPTDAVARFVMDRPTLAVLAAASVFTFELSAPLILFRPRFRVGWALVAVGLHAGTWLAIGLDYWAWAGVVLLVLVDWPAAWSRRRRPIAGVT